MTFVSAFTTFFPLSWEYLPFHTRDPGGLLYSETYIDTPFVFKNNIKSWNNDVDIKSRFLHERCCNIVERRWVVYMLVSEYSTRSYKGAWCIRSDVASGLSNPRDSYFFLRTRMVSIARSKRKIHEWGETEICGSDTRESPLRANYQGWELVPRQSFRFTIGDSL